MTIAPILNSIRTDLIHSSDIEYQNIRDRLLEGIASGFWDDVSEDNQPIMYNRITIGQTGPLMAHALYDLGVFKSVLEGKINGWNYPVERGKFSVHGRTVVIE